MTAEGRAEQDRGRAVTSPLGLDRRGWRDVVVRVGRSLREDNVPIVAAGIAFYGWLALVPGLVFVALVAGVGSSPEEVAAQIGEYLSGASAGGGRFVETTLTEASAVGGDGIGLGAAVAVVGLLWVASGGADGLIRGINIAYDEPQRSFPRRRALAVLMSLIAIAFGVVAFLLVVSFPASVDRLPLAPVGRVVVGVARWVALLALVLVGLGVLYRFGPNRTHPKVRWVSIGAVVAALVWLLGSGLFVLYVEWLGGFGARYGALAGVVVINLWLFVTAFSILLGAEINAELEAQTRRDSTVGDPRPLGERGAVKPDTVADAPDGPGSS